MKRSNLWKLVSLFALMLTLVACGGNGDSSNNNVSENDTDAPPTSTPFPTFAFVAPTNPPAFNQNAESTDEAAPDIDENPAIEIDPTKVARGLGRYEALDCGICHGENAEGSDDVPALAGFDLTEDEFITFLRTGGTIGSSHQYSTDRLSDSGTRNLYQYFLSLSQDS